MAKKDSISFKTKASRNAKDQSGNLKLPPYREPYWIKFPPEIAKGASLGFRRSPETSAETWHGRVYLNGEYHKTNLGPVTDDFEYKDAYKAALKWAQKIKDSGQVVAKTYTVEDVMDDYLTQLQGNSSRRNIDKRRQAEKRLDALLSPALKRRKVNDLTKQDLTKLQREYSQRRNKQGQLISPDSVNRVMTHFIAALNHGLREGMVENKNAWQHYRRLKGATTKRREKQYIPMDEREAFLKACSGPLNAYITAMHLMAARPSEIRRLRVSDVDLKEGKVRVVTYKGSSGGAVRYVPLPKGSALQELFADQVKDKEPDNRVFTTDRGLPWTQANLAKHHNKVRDDNGFSESFETYAWRHARITDWAGQYPSPEVAAMAGTSLAIIEANYYKPNADIRAAMVGM